MPMESGPPPIRFTLVANPADWDRALQAIGSAPIVCFDLESNGFFHYSERVSLMQFAVPGQAFIVDPIVLGEPRGLGELFSDPRKPKVLHGCDYDLRSLDREYGINIRGLYDTAIATQLLNPELMGLARAIETYLGIRVSKPARLQRSDWSRRPLPPDALAYAAADVVHLEPLKAALDAKLVELGRTAWMEEECALMERIRFEEPEPIELSAVTAKGTYDLSPMELAVFREVYLFRECEAERLDRPPFKVMSNEAILALARDPGRRPEELPGASRHWLAEAAGGLKDAARRGAKAPPVTHPSKTKRSPNPWYGEARERWQRMHAARLGAAKALGIGAAVLWPTKSLEAIALDPACAAAELSGESGFGVRKWQRQVFGPAVEAALAQPGA